MLDKYFRNKPLAASMHNHTKCRICRNQTTFLWAGQLIGLTVNYYECHNCKYVQTESPHWLEKAYADAINESDTGIVSRNLSNARVTMASLLALRRLRGPVVDYAGGYGMLVRILRDSGIDAAWSDKFCKNLLARGFENKPDFPETSPILVTAFEALEHFSHPIAELDSMFSIAPNALLSTYLIPDPPPPQSEWWYYGVEHGQHIGFFRLRTLQWIAQKYNKHLVSNGVNFHLVSDAPISNKYWEILLRLKGFSPLLFRLLLQPKTWQDHLYIKNKSKQ